MHEHKSNQTEQITFHLIMNLIPKEEYWKSRKNYIPGSLTSSVSTWPEQHFGSGPTQLVWLSLDHSVQSLNLLPLHPFQLSLFKHERMHTSTEKHFNCQIGFRAVSQELLLKKMHTSRKFREHTYYSKSVETSPKDLPIIWKRKIFWIDPSIFATDMWKISDLGTRATRISFI